MLTETCIALQRLITCSHSAGETLTRSATFHALTQTSDHQEEEGLPQQRRTTIGESSAIIRILERLFYMTLLLWFIYNSKMTLQSCFFMPFMQHHICLSLRIRMETSLWRYCKPSKQGLQGGITRSPELLQLQNMLCLYFPAPLIRQSNDSANRLRILVLVSRICQARLLVSLAIHVLAETQNGKRFFFVFVFFKANCSCPVFIDSMRQLSIASH